MMHQKIIFFYFFITSAIALYAQQERIEYLPTFDKRKKQNHPFYQLTGVIFTRKVM